MTSIPSWEAILMEICQSFGLNKLQTEPRRRFAENRDSLQHHKDSLKVFLDGIFDCLGCAQHPALADDLFSLLMEMSGVHSVVENYVRTFGAKPRQVAWVLIANEFAPYLGRKYGFWSSSAPVAARMPGGDLWFLPRPSSSDPGRLHLPVQTAVDWWRDLLDSPLESIWRQDEQTQSFVRNLYNWEKGRLPDVTTLDKVFQEGRGFTYNGAYADQAAAAPDARYAHARAFVIDRKRLDSAALARQIPHLPVAVIDAALSGSADAEQRAAFVTAIARRWHAPSTATVRLIFMLARAIQDGHSRLAQLLCPAVDPATADPSANKILQVWALFEKTYRLTLEADRSTQSVAESNALFETLVPHWLATGPLRHLLCLQPPTPKAIGDWMSRCFAEMDDNGELGDLFQNGNIAAGPAEHRVNASTVDERHQYVEMMNEVWSELNSRRADGVEALLRRLETHPRRQEFDADLALCRGRHRLNHNDLDGAREQFEQAFEASRLGGYGNTRSRAAYARLGVAVASEYYTNHLQKYARVIAFDLSAAELQGRRSPTDARLEDIEELFADLAVRAAEQLWTVFYRPYPGAVSLMLINQKHSRGAIKILFDAIRGGDLESVRRWVEQNKELTKSRIRDVRGDTILSLAIKVRRLYMETERRWLGGDNRAIKSAGAVYSAGLHQLATALPARSLDIPDFKKQTPLMLAASQADGELVRILLDRGVDLDAQDLLGRTALHAAAASHAAECYRLILKKGADPRKQTSDGYSPLHTAVKLGVPEAVDATLDQYPGLFAKEFISELLALTRTVLSSYDRVRQELATNGRQVSLRRAYRKIEDRLVQAAEVTSGK
ncbi:MAG: ankyrin repeat domain-containing protein [Thermohalobaculum sp.]